MAGNEIIVLGILLLAGFGGGKIAQAARLPSVCGYLLAGLLLGSSVLGVVTFSDIERLEFINSISLSLIALTVGSKLVLEDLKGSFAPIAAITLLQVLAVGTGTTAAMKLMGVSTSMALLLAAAALAPAAATIMAVVEETRSSGPFTGTLLAVTALSNVMAVVLFGFAIASVPALQTNAPFSVGLAQPALISLGGSLLLGLIMGLALSRIAHRARNRQELLIMIVGTAFLTSELARTVLNFSPLLISISIGFVLVNLCPVRDRLFEAIESVELPVYITFFSLQGAHLDIRLLGHLGWVGLVYILARAALMVAGTTAGALLSRAPDVTRRYLGPALIPQAGVSVGMVVAVQLDPACSDFALAVTTLILSSILVNELIGPVISKVMLIKSGETGAVRHRIPLDPGGE